MARWMLAGMLALGGLMAIGPSRSAPITQTDDDPATDEVATGTCSYSCSSNGHTYVNRNACRAACSGVCTVEAC